MVRTRIAIAAAALLGACTSGPDYKKPAIDAPVAWKVEAPWRAVAPNDAAPKGPWWKGYNDARLDQLQEKALADSATLAIAGARLAQSRAALAAVSAAEYVQVGVGARDNFAGDHAAGAAAIVDDELAAQSVSQFVRDHAA